MAKINWKLDMPNSAHIDLIEKIRYHGSRLWANVVLSKGGKIRAKISQMLVNAFNETDVAMSLRGKGSDDLPAHFGLSDSLANSLADGMANLIASSVKVITTSSGNSVSVTIKAIDKDWGEYLNLPGASYISSQSDIVIPVAKWMLVDPTIDIGQAAYDIVFKGDDDKFDVRIQHTSRSGRAIMVALQALGGGGGGYVLPDIISGNAGENFIEYTLGQQKVAISAANILMGEVG